MPSGVDIALGEITLVLFTTLAPSGVVAFMLMGLMIVRGNLDEALRRRINQFLSIPLVVSMAGLVASATHLGNPANALYVFAGVGRSPLSTEVFCAVVFLALAGVYWLHSFAERPRAGLQRLWMGVAMAAGCVFVTAVAFAYDAATIVSWHTAYTPAGLWLNALVGGPLLALLSLRAAGCSAAEGRFGRVLVALSLVALAANVACYVLQGCELAHMENSLTVASERVPRYGIMVAAFAALCLGAVALDGVALARARLAGARLMGLRREAASDASAGEPVGASAEKGSRSTALPLSRAVLACALAFAGIFIMRFAFYMTHMTVGLGL